MYVVAILVIVFYATLGYLARREDAGIQGSKLLRPFYGMAQYLYKQMCIRNISFVHSLQAEMDLAKMHPGERKERLAVAYYVEKIARSLLLCLVGTFLAVIVSLKSQESELLVDENAVHRGEYEEGARSIVLQTRLPEGKQEFAIQIGPKEYTNEELQSLYVAFLEALPELILGDNESLREVTVDLALEETYAGYPFLLDWESKVPEVIKSDGCVSEVGEALEIVLVADICYGEREWEERLTVRVVPPVLSKEALLYRKLEKLLIDSEKEDRTEQLWRLPDNWEGEELLWSEKREDWGPLLWLGTIGLAILIYCMTDRDLHEEVEKKKNRMRRSYPDVVYKLVLYFGAGMTIRGSFQRLAEEYEQERAAGKEQMPIYEEVLHTCRELGAGVAEGAAYEHFGKRTGLQEYTRLATLLAQNLKKGNSALLQRLREEVAKASEERIQQGKRLGEEAVTKLLLPMVMMLLVVMVMIMIPAFSSVGM